MHEKLEKTYGWFFFLMNDKLSIFFQKDLSIVASRIKNAAILKVKKKSEWNLKQALSVAYSKTKPTPLALVEHAVCDVAHVLQPIWNTHERPSWAIDWAF